MYKGKIIDLDNISYLVLEETKFGSRDIILAAVINEAQADIDTDNLLIKEVINKDGSLEIISLTDTDEINELSKLLLNKYAANN
jgi:hypothetical protein